jgi:cytochrome c-type biogenesis protein CcmE
MIESQSAENSRGWRHPTSRQTKLLIGGFIVVLAVGYLILTAMGGSAAYYHTVAELKAQGPSARSVRVAGTIVGQSIVWKARDLTLQFEIADQSGTLPVVYHGPRPDMFQDGAEVVVEGQYTSGGIFEARTLLLKCPSKYEEASKGG